jgi:hypothetical protein
MMAVILNLLKYYIINNYMYIKDTLFQPTSMMIIKNVCKKKYD